MYCTYLHVGANVELQAPIDTSTMTKSAIASIDAANIEPQVQSEYAKTGVLTVKVVDINGIPIGSVPRPRAS